MPPESVARDPVQNTLSTTAFIAERIVQCADFFSRRTLFMLMRGNPSVE